MTSSRPSPDRQAAYQSGIWAERWGALYLTAKGYRILARRFRTPAGEIDLIATRWGVVVFFEVKLRTRSDDALEAVKRGQIERITRAAGLFLAQHPRWQSAEQRFDILAIVPWKLPIHIKNAW